MNSSLEDMFEDLSVPTRKHQVAVWMPCFNAENWVSEAIESVLFQKEVDAVLIVFDDCSTDGTREILRNLSEQYPGKLFVSRPLFNSFTSGNKVIQLDLIELVDCDYIAILEADDFWNSPDKLLLSIDAIDKTGAAASGHAVNVLGVSKKANIYRALLHGLSSDGYKNKFYQNPGFLPWTVPTCSLVVRRSSFPFSLKSEIATSSAGDLITKLGLLKEGHIEFIEEVLGTYRIHDESMWSSKGIFNRSLKTARILLSVRGVMGTKRTISSMIYGVIWAFLVFKVSIKLRGK